MKTLHLLGLCGCVLIAGLISVEGGTAEGGTTYYVAVDGDDGTEGLRPESAFATVQRGVDALSPGDELVIAAGEYFGGVVREHLGSPEAETVIRAAIPGTVILRGDVPGPKFRKVEGYRFVYAADFEGDVQAVNELETLRILGAVPGIAELDFKPGRFYHDRERNRLYLSTPDFMAADSREYTVSVTPAHGIILYEPQRVRLEGLSVTGFSSLDRVPPPRGRPGWGAQASGISLSAPTGSIVRDCRAWLNGGYGIVISHGASEETGGNVIEACSAWANGSGIEVFWPRSDDIRDSQAFLNANRGFCFYGRSTNSRMLDNRAWGNRGVEYIFKGSVHNLERCVGPGNWYMGASHLPVNCLIGSYPRMYHDPVVLQTSISLEDDLEPEAKDAEFADPLNHDYRLQATSRFRGAAADGGDRGLPYRKNVYYVAQGGDDTADGLSMSGAWASPARAAEALRPGDTLYIAPGSYAGALRVSAGEAGDERIFIRGRGVGTVEIAGPVRLENAGGLTFERLRFSGPVSVEGGSGLTFEQCVFAGNGPSLSAQAVDGLRLVHCEFSAENETLVALTECQQVFLSGNRFDNAVGVAVSTDRAESVLFADYNVYRRPASAWRLAGSELARDHLPDGWERYGTGMPAAEATDGGLAPRGPHGRPAGLSRWPAEMDFRMTEPRVHSVSAMTANLEWWSSLPATFELAWGETPETRNPFSEWSRHSSNTRGNFTSFSLTGLEPGKTYYFRVRSARQIGAESPEPSDSVATGMLSFETAATPADPKVYFVAPDGDDQASGLRREGALRTVQAAADRVGPGDTVLIAGGVYRETVRIRATGDAGRPITFKAMPGEKVQFSGRGLASAFIVGMKTHHHFDGFYFAQYGGGEPIFALRQTDHIRITRCFQDGRGAWPEGLVGALESANLEISNCFAIQGGSIRLLSSPDARLENNVFIKQRISTLLVENDIDQKVYLRRNIITDNQMNKLSAAFFEIARVESLVKERNCYALRVPDEEREMFWFYGGDAWTRCVESYGFDPDRTSVISELTRMSLKAYQERFGDTGSIVADPLFKWTVEMAAQDREPYQGLVPQRPVAKGDLDFPDLFATHPEIVQKGIGLQPEAFEDFHFNRAE